MDNLPVIIVGAGPAGLSLARELGLYGIEYLVLEKHASVGNTFYSMTDSTTCGPWINNILPGGDLPWHELLSRTRRGDYARYLSEYSYNYRLRVRTNVSVQSVAQADSGFIVQTDDGSLSCQYFVNATGYYSNPFIPKYPGLGTTGIPYIHSADYFSPKTIAERSGKPNAKVLIVGCRLSAGEIMEELHNTGAQVHLSHRGEIKYWPSLAEETVLSPLFMAWELMSLKVDGPTPMNLDPRLRRGLQKRLLDDGVVPLHPDILQFHNESVEFIDGTQEEFDLVLFATGYRATLGHLAGMCGSDQPTVENLESTQIRNLFFLGLVGGRTFRSQFLRGIREDAIYLAEVLAERYRITLERGQSLQTANA